MKYGLLFASLAVFLAASAVTQGGWQLLWLWPAANFGVIATAYCYVGPSIFGKSAKGHLSPIAQILLLPYLLPTWAVWHLLRPVRTEPPFNQLTDRVFIGRRLLSHELPPNIDHVIDLTCEFNEPVALRSLSYFSFPILDGFVPPVEQLKKWILEVSGMPGTIYIHCAEGHGRTGLFAAALLFTLGDFSTPMAALDYIRSKRPLVRLDRRQLTVLNACCND